MARLLKFPSADRDGNELESRKRGSNAQELTRQEKEFLPSYLELQETPPPPYQRALLWSIAALVVSIFVWSIAGTLKVVSIAPGKFIPLGRLKVVQVTETAVVRAIHVKEGQKVVKGDLLMELDPTLAEADLTSVDEGFQQNELNIERLRAQLAGEIPHYRDIGVQPGTDKEVTENGNAYAGREGRIRLQENLRQASEAAYQLSIETARMQLREKRAALDAASSALHKNLSLKSIAEEKYIDSRALREENFISKTKYLKDYAEWISADQDYATQTHVVEQALRAFEEAEKHVKYIEQQHQTDLLKEINESVERQSELKGRLKKAEKIHALKWLYAPVSGYVQSVSVTTTGGVVTPAQNLVTIVPEGTPLVVEASLSNEDIGYVAVGQPVEIKVDTYPFQKYGTLKGTLTSISPDAEQKSGNQYTDSSEGMAGEAQHGPVYRVYVTPDKNAGFSVGDRSENLLPGMSVQADIETDTRKIYQFFLSPIVKYLDEGTSVR